METTRFLFPEETGETAQRNVFEPNAEGTMPVMAGERNRQPCMSPAQHEPRRDGSLAQWSPVPGSADSRLAQYKHYDVQLDWSEVPFLQYSDRVVTLWWQ